MSDGWINERKENDRDRQCRAAKEPSRDAAMERKDTLLRRDEFLAEELRHHPHDAAVCVEHVVRVVQAPELLVLVVVQLQVGEGDELLHEGVRVEDLFLLAALLVRHEQTRLHSVVVHGMGGGTADDGVVRGQRTRRCFQGT